MVCNIKPTLRYIPDDRNLVSQSRHVPHRNHMLPFEVLGLIFHHIPRLGSFNLQPLLFVAKSWHRAVCHHSSLWSDITLDHTIYTVFSVDNIFQRSRASNYLHCCLKYSGTVPLDISLNCRQLKEMSTHAATHIEAQLVPLLRILVGKEEEHSARWRSFTWHAMLEESIPIIHSTLPSALPNLQTLKLLHSFFRRYLDPDLPSCPHLQTVFLYQCDQLRLHETDYSNVVELILGTNHAWDPNDMDVLSAFHNVRRLTLYTVTDPQFFRQDGSRAIKEMLFPYLHTLRLYGKMPRQIVKDLRMPMLKEVEFDEVSSFDHFECYPFASTVQIVHIQAPRRKSNEEALIAKKVMRLLTVVRLLQCLRVPKWLHEELECDRPRLEERGVHLEVTIEKYAMTLETLMTLI